MVGAGQVGAWLDLLVTTHGDVVRWIIATKEYTFFHAWYLTTFAFRCCVPGQKIVVVRENPAKKEGNSGESLDRRNLIDVTLQHLVILVSKLGAKVAWLWFFSRGCWLSWWICLFVRHSGQKDKNTDNVCNKKISGWSYRGAGGDVWPAGKIFLQLQCHSWWFCRAYAVSRELQVLIFNPCNKLFL